MRQLLLILSITSFVRLWLIEMQIVKYIKPQNILLRDKRTKTEETINFHSNELKNKISFNEGELIC